MNVREKTANEKRLIDYYGTHIVTEQNYCPFCGAKMDKES